MALTTAVFGQAVTLLLVGEAVRHLQPGNLALTSTGELAALTSLADYGIQGWAESEALHQAGMAAVDLPNPFRAASRAEISGLIASSRHLWGW